MICYVIAGLICWFFGCYVGWSLERKEKDELMSLKESLHKDMINRLTTAICELNTENKMLRDALDNKDMEDRG